MKTITFANWKGGTGKTTLLISAIKTLSKKGKKILGIDLDSNLSLTRCFDAVGRTHNSIDLLNGTFNKFHADNLTGIPDVHIISSNLRISRMTNISDRTLLMNLKKIDLSEYDYIFIDPPGTMNALTRNAICASDVVIIPSMPSSIDFEATALVFEEMIMLGVEADVSVVLNGYDSKRNINKIKDDFSEEYPDFFYKNPISAMKSLKNLTANIADYELQSRAKQIIDNFVEEVIL